MKLQDRINVVRLGAIGVDSGIVALAVSAAFAVAYGYPDFLATPGIYEKIVASTVIMTLFLHLFGVNKGSWRFVSVIEIMSICKGVLAGAVAFTFLAFLISRGAHIPRSVPPLVAIFSAVGLLSVRFAYRLIMTGDWRAGGIMASRHPGSRTVLLLGITVGAENFVRGVIRSRTRNLSVAGIFDDSRTHRGRLFYGVKIIGGLEGIPAYVEQLKRRNITVSELIVAEDRPNGERLTQILKIGSEAGLKVSRITDTASTSQITTDELLHTQPIELQDLLNRNEVQTDTATIAKLIAGRSVLVTGAGGSIGSELCHQIARFNPRCLILADISEFHLYLIDLQLRERFPDLPIITQIVDTRDAARVAVVFNHQPELVFHAAALKHVALAEQNPVEAIKTNVFGTKNVADAALRNGAIAFIMISTDKAVNPSNVMGATKRAAETYCQALDLISTKTRFKTVRFGNVLGSNGSVVPVFQKQIASGGPVTVTHPRVARFFMTIPEAVQLVLNACANAMAKKTELGKIMVLQMGEPVLINDLAERMIELAGYKPNVDIKITYTGLKPGEKLHEELFEPSEIIEEAAEGYLSASPRVMDKGLLDRTLESLKGAIAHEDEVRSLEFLHHLVPEYQKLALPDTDEDEGDLMEPEFVRPHHEDRS